MEVVINRDSRIIFREYVVHREPGKDPLLGCPEVHTFLEVDDITLNALGHIKPDATLADAEASFAAEHGDEADIVALVKFLHSRKFVASVDGLDTEEPGKANAFLNSISPSKLRWLTHPFLVWGTLVWILVGAVTMLFEPVTRPHFSDLYLFERTSLRIASTLAAFLVVAYLHELAHFFVARRFGIESKIRVSHRFYLLVLQTDVTNAWTLPLRQRLAIFVAGIWFNAFVIACLVFALYLGNYGIIALSGGEVAFLKFLMFVNVFPIIFQLFIPARTDLYHVMSAVSGQRNLLQDSMGYLAYLGQRVKAQVRGEQGDPCRRCRAVPLAPEAYCEECGDVLPGVDPNTYPYLPTPSRGLAAYGVFFLVGTLAGYAFMVWIVEGIASTLLGSAFVTYGLFVTPQSAEVRVEAVLSLLLMLLQVGVMGYFALQGMKQTGGMFFGNQRPSRRLASFRPMTRLTVVRRAARARASPTHTRLEPSQEVAHV